MPNLNTKLLLRVLAVVVILGGAFFALHRVQASRVPDALLWQANTAAEQGKTDRAIFYMRQYLEFRPDDHDTAIKLADLMAERAVTIKDITNAHFLYERVLRESPQRSDVARKLVDLCLRMRRYGDALDHAERLLQESPNDGGIHAQVAECLVAQNRPEDAKKSFEKAISLSPDNVRAFDQYARLLMRRFRQPKEAGLVLDRMVQANPGRSHAYLVRARYLKGQDRDDDCMRDLDRVFLLDPENGEALVMSAEILQSRGDLRRAKEALRETIELYPRFAHGYRALSWLELLSGNHADARATLEKGVAMVPNAPELITPLADLWIEQGELDEVTKAIQKLEARKDSSARVGYLRGRVLMKQRKWNEAVAILESLRADTVALPGVTPQLNLLIAGCHERRGDRDAQMEALRRALAADPKHLAARVALANTHLNAGRFPEAIKEYQAAAQSPFAGLGVKSTLTSLRINVAKCSDTSSDEWKSIDASIAKLRDQNPSAIEPIVLRAESAAARGDFASAIKTLREEAALRPGEPRLWSALAGMLARGHGTLAAMEAIGEGQLAAGDSIEFRLARARLWADDIQPRRAQRLARLEELSPTIGDAERSRFMQSFAELYAAINDDAGQRRVLTAMAQRDQDDLDSRRTLYSLALAANDEPAATRWREDVRRIDPRAIALLDALHQIRTATKADRRLTEWHDLARGIVANSPDIADAHLLLAKVAELLGDSALAIKHLDQAVGCEPTSQRLQQSRLAYLLRSSQDEALRTSIARLDADPRFASSKLRAIVEGAIREGGSEAQSRCLAAMDNHINREPHAAIWAGRLLEERGKVTDALTLYRKCNERHPKFADAWSARLVASARLGEAEVKQAAAAAAKSLDRKAFFSVVAECGTAIQARLPEWTPPVATPNDRRAYAEACLSVCETRGRLEEAVPILSAMADDVNGRAEDVAWAKRTVAAITAALGNADQKREAIASLRDRSRPTTPEEARSRIAALLVAYRTVGGDDRRAVVRELIILLNDLVRDPSATSNDWFQLAQLYRVLGDRTGSRKCLEELTKREPKNLFYLAVNVDDLLGENRLDDARPMVARLEEGLADVRVAASAARFYTLANDPQAVLSIVDRFVRVADAGTTDGMARQRQAAELLDQFTRLAARRGLSGATILLSGACERYRASCRAFPEAVTPMAALLSFSGQVDAAFTELERHKSKLSPTAQATAGVAVLRSGNASSKQFGMVKGWIEESLRAEPKSIALKLNLAELHALRQDFAQAERAYLDVLATDPKNLVALNNLAWILAPRPESADQALRFAERAIELYGATGEILDTRARILISAGQYDRAVADLNDAINQRGTPLRYFHLALAQMRMSKPDEATRTFREARARGLDPKVIHPHDLPMFKVLSERAVQ